MNVWRRRQVREIYEINEHCHNSQVGQRGYLLGTMLKIEANLPTLNALESNPFPPAGRY
jgi:hypothetical protein